MTKVVIELHPMDTLCQNLQVYLELCTVSATSLSEALRNGPRGTSVRDSHDYCPISASTVHVY